MSPEEASFLWMFLNVTVLQGRDVSLSHNTQAVDHPLSAVHCCLFIIHSYAPYRWPFFFTQLESAPWRDDRDPLHKNVHEIIQNTPTCFNHTVIVREHTLFLAKFRVWKSHWFNSLYYFGAVATCRVLFESDAVQLTPALDVFVVPYSVRLALARNELCSLRVIMWSKYVGEF